MNNIVLETVWFFLPAMVANMAPVLAAHVRQLDFLNHPLDGGQSWQGKRLLGDNKTVRGLLVGIGSGGLVGLIQHYMWPFAGIQAISLLSYESLIASSMLGSLIGLGALVGDALKSFCKRRLNIPAGKSWIPFDQIDSVIGVLLMTWWLNVLTLSHVIIACIIIGIASYLTSVIGVKMRIKKSL